MLAVPACFRQGRTGKKPELAAGKCQPWWNHRSFVMREIPTRPFLHVCRFVQWRPMAKKGGRRRRKVGSLFVPSGWQEPFVGRGFGTQVGVCPDISILICFFLTFAEAMFPFPAMVSACEVAQARGESRRAAAMMTETRWRVMIFFLVRLKSIQDWPFSPLVYREKGQEHMIFFLP